MSGTAVPLEYAPFLELTDEQLRAIVDRHGITVSRDELHRLDSMGTVHSIYALSEALVLRVPKLHPDDQPGHPASGQPSTPSSKKNR